MGITTTEAATLAGVTPATIRTWTRRGHLTPTGRTGRTNTYNPTDVIQCEAARWDTGRTRRHTTTLTCTPTAPLTHSQQDKCAHTTDDTPG